MLQKEFRSTAHGALVRFEDEFDAPTRVLAPHVQSGRDVSYIVTSLEVALSASDETVWAEALLDDLPWVRDALHRFANEQQGLLGSLRDLARELEDADRVRLAEAARETQTVVEAIWRVQRRKRDVVRRSRGGDLGDAD